MSYERGGQWLTENEVGESEEVVERAMKTQLNISISKAQYIAQHSAEI